MNDERKQPIPLWPDGCVWILCSSSIGAILKIFLTPIDTSGNDIGAGLGNLIVHPVVHGSIGAIGGAFIGSLAFFLFRNGKQSKLSPIIQNTSPLNAEESAKVIETAIRKAAKKPTGKLTKADFEKVIVMDLQDKGLTDVKGLEKLTQLTHLYLDYNQLTDVKGLEKLTQLTYLYLSDNQLTDVKGLEKLTQLRWLQLYNNKLTDVKDLEKLTQLTFLDLSNNKLTDVKGLENLTRLTDLRLGNNPALTKAQIAELKKALPKCKIKSNPPK